jgi:uncharacterized protein YcbK (DUF882 family)
MILGRRSLMAGGLGLAGALTAAPLAQALGTVPARRLAFENLHTGESLDIDYWENGVYLPGAMAEVNYVLRDFRTNEVHVMEPRLLDLLCALSIRLQSQPRFAVISGYRSPATNAMLHAHSSEVASGSLHMQGMAIDIRMPELELTRVREAAMSLAIGGVGYYPASDFVHVDIGRVRHWGGT